MMVVDDSNVWESLGQATNKYIKTVNEVVKMIRKLFVDFNEFLETLAETERLVDIANFAMIEYMHPSFSDAHFFSTPASESPGLADGISYNELMREMEDSQ